MRRFPLLAAFVVVVLATVGAAPLAALPVFIDRSVDFPGILVEVVQECQEEVARLLPGMGFQLIVGQDTPLTCSGNVSDDLESYSEWYQALPDEKRGLRVMLVPSGNSGGYASRVGSGINDGSFLGAVVNGSFWESLGLGRQIVCQRIVHELTGHVVGALSDGGGGIMGGELGPNATWVTGQVETIATNVPLISSELQERGVVPPLTLRQGEFTVGATWQKPSGEAGYGTPVSLTSDTGYFWFFNPANVEMVVKVLNGCSVNGRYWVFASGLTNVRVVFTVTHIPTGNVKTYQNSMGLAFQPIQDTNAFATCP